MKKYKQKLEVRKEKIGLWFTNVKEIINYILSMNKSLRMVACYFYFTYSQVCISKESVFDG